MTRLPFCPEYAFEREPLALPDGARVAVYVAPNVEVFPPGRPAISLFGATAGAPGPDPLNTGWREYGVRVGLWRIAEAIEAHGYTPAVALNAAVCREHPRLVAEGVRRGWEWICHGEDNATFHVGMDEDAERAALTAMLDELEAATGARPRGWLGPALTETWATPRILAELGCTHTLDWGFDDVPFLLDVDGPPLVAVPYLVEAGDIPILHLHGRSAEDFAQTLIRHFDRLWAEGADRPAVMGISVHPFLVGQPSRIGALERVLAHIGAHEGVWRTTPDELATWYLTPRT